MENKNGKIDLIKFILAIFVMTLHYKWRPVLYSIGNHKIIFAQSGYYAVVVFFIISGALFSISAYNKQYLWSKKKALSEIAIDSQKFIIKKYKKFIIWYFVALFIYIFIDLSIDLIPIKKIISNVFWTIPSCLLLGHTGFNSQEIYQGGYYVGASWYIGALMIMYCVFFPIIRWSYDMFVKVIAPIVFVILIYINISIWNTNITSSRLYPLIPFVLGTIVGDLAVQIYRKNCKLRIIESVAICIVEAFCYIVVGVLLCINYEDMPMIEYPVLFIAAIAVSITLSRINLFKFFNNYMFDFIGKWSFIVYMLHIPIGLVCHKIVIKYGCSLNSNELYILETTSTLVVTFLMLSTPRIKEILFRFRNH